jgi:hypothetical protein
LTPLPDLQLGRPDIVTIEFHGADKFLRIPAYPIYIQQCRYYEDLLNERLKDCRKGAPFGAYNKDDPSLLLAHIFQKRGVRSEVVHALCTAVTGSDGGGNGGGSLSSIDRFHLPGNNDYWRNEFEQCNYLKPGRYKFRPHAWYTRIPSIPGIPAIQVSNEAYTAVPPWE